MAGSSHKNASPMARCGQFMPVPSKANGAHSRQRWLLHPIVSRRFRRSCNPFQQEVAKYLGKAHWLSIFFDQQLAWRGRVVNDQPAALASNATTAEGRADQMKAAVAHHLISSSVDTGGRLPLPPSRILSLDCPSMAKQPLPHPVDSGVVPTAAGAIWPPRAGVPAAAVPAAPLILCVPLFSAISLAGTFSFFDWHGYRPGDRISSLQERSVCNLPPELATVGAQQQTVIVLCRCVFSSPLAM